MARGKRFCEKWMAAGAAAALCLGMSFAAQADQFGIRATGGIGTHGINKADLGLLWNQDITWWDTGHWHFPLICQAHGARGFAMDGAGFYAAGVTPLHPFLK